MQVAWRHEHYGLAALMAVAWDSQLSLRSAVMPLGLSWRWIAPRQARPPPQRSRDGPKPFWLHISGSLVLSSSTPAHSSGPAAGVR